jgi:hypothetical protein
MLFIYFCGSGVVQLPLMDIRESSPMRMYLVLGGRVLDHRSGASYLDGPEDCRAEDRMNWRRVSDSVYLDAEDEVSLNISWSPPSIVSHPSTQKSGLSREEVISSF